MASRATHRARDTSTIARPSHALRRSKDPQIVIKASDILIARRADTKARADFPTWRMMAKLNAISSLSSEAQAFLADYEKRLKEMNEAEATEATIQAIYRSYYAEMGGAGAAPDASIAHPKAHLKGAPSAAPANAGPRAAETPPDNVIALQQARRAQQAKPAAATPAQKPRLPVALIFICLIVITVGLRYLL